MRHPIRVGPGAAGTMVADVHAAARDVLTALSKAQRSQALQRGRTLRPSVKDAVRLAGVPADAGVPERTARRWRTRYRAGGLAGGASRPTCGLDGLFRRMPC